MRMREGVGVRRGKRGLRWAKPSWAEVGAEVVGAERKRQKLRGKIWRKGGRGLNKFHFGNLGGIWGGGGNS